MTTEQVPPPPPVSLSQPKWASGSKAEQEQKNWDNEGLLRGQEEKNHLWWLKAYGFLMVALLTIFSFLFVGSLVSWSAHYLLPACWHWLDSDQLSKIQSILFSGSVGGFISVVAQKQLSK